MANSEIVRGSEIIEKDIFLNSTKSAEDLTLALLDMKEAFVVVNNESKKFLQSNKDPKTYEQIKNVNKALNESIASRKGLESIDKELNKIKQQNIQLEQKLKQLQDEKKKAIDNEKKAKKELTEQEKVQQQLERQASAERVKQLKAEAILLDQNAGLEAKITAQLTLLRIERSKLKDAEGANAKEFKRLNAEIDKQNELLNSLSDKQKKAKANVGNYTESIKQAIDESEAFKTIIGGINNQSGVFVTATRGVVNQLKSIRASFKEAEGAGGKFKAILKGGAGATLALAGGIFAGAVATDRQLSVNVEKFTSKIGNSLVASFEFALKYIKEVFLPTSQNLFLEIQRDFAKFTLNFEKANDIQKQIDKNKKAIDSYNGSFEDLFNTINKGNELIDKQIDLQQQLIDTSNLYQVSIAKLNGLAEIQGEIAGDSTRSFNELKEANLNQLKLIETRIAREKELAKITLDNVTAQAKLVFLNKGKDVTDQQLKSLSFIKDENLQKTLGVELQQKLTDAVVNYNQKNIESNISQIKIQRELRQIKQDELERDLDFLIDGLDNQKAVNEKIIADQTKLFEKRKALLTETTELSNDSFKQQEEVFQQFTKKRVDLQDLVETKDAKILAEKVRSLGLSEIIEGRVLEAVRERRLLLQDIADLERDIAQQERDKNIRIAESQNQVQNTQYNLEKDRLERSQRLEEQIQDANLIYKVDKLKEYEQIKADLDEKQAFLEMERQKEIARRTIVEQDELNAKLVELEAQYAEKVQTIERDKADKIKELNRKRFNSEVNEANKVVQDLLTNFDSYLNARNDKQNNALQKDIDRGQKAIDRQQELAEKGAANQLAFEEQQQAKREAQQIELQEKQAKQQEYIQLTQAYFNALNARLTQVGANPDDAPIKALQDVFLAKGLAKSVVQFAKDGNERVQPINGKGGQIGVDDIPFMLTRDEGVVTRDANLGNPGVVSALNKGIFDKLYMPRIDMFGVSEKIMAGSTANNMYESLLLQNNIEIKETLKRIASKPSQYVDVDSFGNFRETIINDASKKVITHKKKLI